MDIHPAQLEREQDEAVGAVCVYVSVDCVCVICVAIHVYTHMGWMHVFVCVYWGYMFNLTTGWPCGYGVEAYLPPGL